MKFLSLGAGVQSSVMLMLAVRGEIERPDHVIFADTGLEPEPVYEHLEFLKKESDIPIHIAKAKLNMLEEFEAFERGDKNFWNLRPPFWLAGKGPLARQCTRDAKIRPINRLALKLMGHKTARTAKDLEAEFMIGISTDEARRANPGGERWYERTYPLIDPLKMSRADCQSWWEKHYPGVNLPSSACIICPYLNSQRWTNMRLSDFKKACDLDERISKVYWERTEQKVYIHKDKIRIRDHKKDRNNFDLDDDLICPGGCGL